MDIKKGENMFFVGEDELNPEAEITYHIDDDGDYVIDHTEVDDSLSGEGVGQQLVGTMAEFADQEGRKINAQCEYAKSVMEKDEEMKKIMKG